MNKHESCGEHIVFRYIDGIVRPMHAASCTSPGAFGAPSMSALAEGLGYSVVFPVECRHCGGAIWLYANPNGGFAIFNSLGKPWPKHQCRKIAETIKGCVFRKSPSPDYAYPVPSSATLEHAKPGTEVKGVIVEIKDTALPSGQWQGHLLVYSGEEDRLYRVVVERSVEMGAYIKGKVTTSASGAEVLAIAELQIPPTPKAPPPPRATVRFRIGTRRADSGWEGPAYASFRVDCVVRSVAEVVAWLRPRASVLISWPRGYVDLGEGKFLVDGQLQDGPPSVARLTWGPLAPLRLANRVADLLEILHAECPSAVTITVTGKT